MPTIIDNILNDIANKINNGVSNFSEILNPKIYNQKKGIFFIIFNGLILTLNIIALFTGSDNGFISIQLIYLLIYFYFINCITIKSVCGLHTSFTETLKIFDSLKLFWLYTKYSFGNIDEKDYIKLLKETIKCFSYKNLNEKIEQNKNFTFQNMLNIENLNTNLNIKILLQLVIK